MEVYDMSIPIINRALDYIRGYHDVDGAIERGYNYEYELYDNVLDALIETLQSMIDDLYPGVYDEVIDDLNNLSSLKWGPEIRNAIYRIFRTIAVEYDVSISYELSLIRYAHYGRDMREPLFDALIKMGANQDFYYNAKSTDFIYEIINNEATLIRYIGPHRKKIKIPETVNDLIDPDISVPVKTLSAILFTNSTWLIGIKIPDSVTLIE